MSLKLLSQCLTATGTPTNIAVSSNNASADVTLCVTGARTEVVSFNATTGTASAAKVAGADRATGLCTYTSNGFLVALPNGSVQYVQAGQQNNNNNSNNIHTTTIDAKAKAVGTCPLKGAHFTLLASSSTSNSSAAAADDGGYMAGASSSSTIAYGVTRDEIYYIDANVASSSSSSAGAAASSSPSSSSSSIVSLGRLAGAAALPITKLTVVPENPFLLIAAVHNRLLQIDTRESTGATGGILGAQRSWLLPSSGFNNGSKVSSLSVSGTWIAAGTSDGRMCIWDVRSSEGVPLDVVNVSNPSSSATTSASSPIGGPYSGYPTAAAAATGGVTSCNLLGAGTVFTTDMRGYARVWMRPSSTLPFEGITLAPLNTTQMGGGASSSFGCFAVASPAYRCGGIGSRMGGNAVFAAVDDLGVVSVFGEAL